MKTGTHPDGTAIYGPRPTREAMLARLKRDGANPDNLRECLRRVSTAGRHYWVEAWSIPAQQEDQFYAYTTRRDGRVQISWVPLDARDIEHQQENRNG